jgi:hypothetical protein
MKWLVISKYYKNGSISTKVKKVRDNYKCKGLEIKVNTERYEDLFNTEDEARKYEEEILNP